MNLTKYSELIKQSNENRHVLLTRVLPKLKELTKRIWDTLHDDGTIFVIGQHAACHSIAEYLARELSSLTDGESGQKIRSHAISIPHLLSYDNPDEVAKSVMMSQIKSKDMVILFSLTSTLGYLKPAFEALTDKGPRIVIIGSDTESLSRASNALVISLELLDPWEYIELQLAVATLLIRMAADRSIKDRGN